LSNLIKIFVFKKKGVAIEIGPSLAWTADNEIPIRPTQSKDRQNLEILGHRR